jgi:hypothetical protein
MVKEYDINSEVITEIEGHILDHPYFYGPDYLSLFNQESVMTFHLNTSNNDVSYLLNYLKGGDPTIDGQCF